MTQDSAAGGEAIVITVASEDSGREVEVHAGPGTPVRTVIERGYAELGVTRHDGDRLRVETTGDSVFGHENQHLGAFVTAEGGCVVWLLAGPTGGA